MRKCRFSEHVTTWMMFSSADHASHSQTVLLILCNKTTCYVGKVQYLAEDVTDVFQAAQKLSDIAAELTASEMNML